MQEMIEIYLEKYLPRKDIIHRLPVSLPISKVWPELQKARKDKSESLPLLSIMPETFSASGAV